MDTSTSNAAWKGLISQTGMVAKCHFELMESLNGPMMDALKGTIARKEESRKKHVAFYQKLKAERDRTYQDKDKAKGLYDDSCMEIQNIRNKIAKGTGDQEKYQRQLDNAIIECNNKKNAYLLALSVANAEREKYYEEDLPMLADQLQELDSTRVLALQEIYRSYIEKTSSTMASIKHYYAEALGPVDQMDATADATIFQSSHLPDPQQQEDMNKQFSFVPWNGGANAAGTAVDTDDRLVIDEPSVIFLNNKLIKDRRRLDQLGDELSRNSDQMKSFESELKSIQNKASAQYDVTHERLVEVARNVTMLSTQKARVKSEVDLIIQSIGDSGLNMESHDFKASSFTIPTTCDYCGNTIWGLSKQGMTCKACGLNCHAKCEMKVAPNCTKVKGKINRYHPSPAPQPSPSSTPRTSNATRPSSSLPTSPTTAAPLGTQTIAVESTLSVRALYDYTAQSPDELTINEGELLNIIGSEDDGENGWLKVARGQQSGYVPANYITFEQTTPSPSPPPPAATSIETSPSPQQPIEAQQPIQAQDHLQEEQHPVVAHEQSPPPSPPTYVVAMYDFEAVNSDELNIREGDRILVTKRDDSGWWEGTLNGRSGMFPANYVE